MLAITRGAGLAIQGVLAGVNPPRDAVLRISSEREDGQHWTLTVRGRRAADDLVVRQQGVEVTMSQESASALDDKILDARVEGGGLRFVLADRG